jgi:phosphohistidine phosphatase
MRHGQAEPQQTTDDSRRLTAPGLAMIEAGAKGLRALGVKPTALVHSPYVRAVQTAQAVAAALGTSLRMDDRITPDAPPTPAVGILAPGMMVVAHMPILPRMVELMTGQGVAFGLGSVVQLEHVEGHRWLLQSLWTIEQLAAVAGVQGKS